ATLIHITGEVTGQCPLCRQGKLTWRQFDSGRCPVCRTGRLSEGRDLRCPVCRKNSLEQVTSSLLTVFTDVWWACPGCQARFQVFKNGEARLAGRNEVLPAEEWQRIAGERYWACDRCLARLEAAEDARLRLTRFKSDPYGVGQ